MARPHTITNGEYVAFRVNLIHASCISVEHLVPHESLELFLRRVAVGIGMDSTFYSVAGQSVSRLRRFELNFHAASAMFVKENAKGWYHEDPHVRL